MNQGKTSFYEERVPRVKKFSCRYTCDVNQVVVKCVFEKECARLCVHVCVYVCVCVPACMCVFSIAWTRIRWEITFGMALQ